MPTARPISSRTTRLSASSPMPAAAPAASHQRGRSRSSAVLTHSRTAVQASRSSGVVLPMCTAPTMTGAHAVVRAASIRPKRPAPNRAASLAAMITIDSARQRRDDPDGRRADPEYAGDPGQQRRQRRLVDVAEREMVPGHDEVQLVLLEAVPAAHSELDCHEYCRDHPRQYRHAIRPGRWGQRCRAVFRDSRLRTCGLRAAVAAAGLIHRVPPAVCPAGEVRQQDGGHRPPCHPRPGTPREQPDVGRGGDEAEPPPGRRRPPGNHGPCLAVGLQPGGACGG